MKTPGRVLVVRDIGPYAPGEFTVPLPPSWLEFLNGHSTYVEASAMLTNGTIQPLTVITGDHIRFALYRS